MFSDNDNVVDLEASDDFCLRDKDGPSPIYGKLTNHFTMKLHVGGYFKIEDGSHMHEQGKIEIGNRVYAGGTIEFYDKCRIDKVNFWRFKELALKLKIDFYSVKFYYRVPGSKNDMGLHQIMGEETAKMICYYIPIDLLRMINIYIDKSMVGDIRDDMDGNENFLDSKMSSEANMGSNNVVTTLDYEVNSDLEAGYIGRESKVYLKDDINLENVEFHVSMMFGSVEVVRHAMKLYEIKNGRKMQRLKNDKNRFAVQCMNPRCLPWRMTAIRLKNVNTFIVKECHKEDQHKCERNYKCKQVTSSFVAKEHLDFLKNNVGCHWRTIANHVRQNLHVDITEHQVKWAKRKAKDLIHGKYEEQYYLLKQYVVELKKANLNTTAELVITNVEGPTGVMVDRFESIYVCLGSVKEGFVRGCRKYVGLDGCFLSGPDKGQLLCAVGIDADGGIYPVAYAVTDGESEKTWKWFMELLVGDLEIESGEGWTFMSDEHPGLIKVVKNLTPQVEYRHCAWHILQNFTKGVKVNNTIKIGSHFWAIARATTKTEFSRCMQSLKNDDFEAYKWLKNKDPKCWSKAYFSSLSVCDYQVNNHCESFNKVLKKYRSEPFLTLLESIRQYIRDRFNKKKQEITKWTHVIGPNTLEDYRLKVKESRKCQAIHNGGNVYEVTFGSSERVVVDLNSRTCTCYTWTLSGLPCAHAISCIMYQNGDPIIYIHPKLTRQYFELAYLPNVDPIPSWHHWELPDKLSDDHIVPPIAKKRGGRPRKNRFKSSVSDFIGMKGKSVIIGKGDKPDRMKRIGVVIKCSICGQPGHNMKTCKKRSGQIEQEEKHGHVLSEESVQEQLSVYSPFSKRK